MHTEFRWRNLTRDHLENLGVIGRMILKWLIWSRIGADWINGAADTDKRWAVVKAVMNLWAPWNVGNFLTSWETVSFSGRTHDVTHWTHVLDSVTLKDPFPSPNQNKLPTHYRHVHPDCGTQRLAWRLSERRYITSLPVRVQCRTNYAEPFQNYYSLRSPQSQLTVERRVTSLFQIYRFCKMFNIFITIFGPKTSN